MARVPDPQVRGSFRDLRAERRNGMGFSTRGEIGIPRQNANCMLSSERTGARILRPTLAEETHVVTS